MQCGCLNLFVLMQCRRRRFQQEPPQGPQRLCGAACRFGALHGEGQGPGQEGDDTETDQGGWQ